MDRVSPPVPLGARLLRRARRFGRAEGGSALLEFAFVAPALIALILAVLELALVFFAQQALETGVEAAARTLVTGSAQAADISGAAAGMSKAQLQERFRQQACAALPSFLSCANLMVDVQSASSFSQISTGAPTISYDANGAVTNNWSYDTGGAGSIVMLRLMYIWPVPLGPLGLNFSNAGDGKRLLIATSVAKSEAYS
ncbi:TadE/TadG family type IV pilus assembly protein [Sphingomonas morindae]|uniref:Pilus assembly protein n=1 Tax=Sphingomonas morindae TaxID=1541170 RepID=A0ABY4X5U0_9SPHN|nr:TadE/TadG family type IV pilus assembly protein [Sphingomonas morindae]USI72212.1 pilus assembly protein [Sphingomonas morindae]